ncbi:MAG: hypothetical protein Q8J85_04730 [Sulfuricurvum sp.]|nr:hypothetical protein [Sulfuricurvum sp.]MDP3022710.1 hypothetical protein [Sulfuricurvum sp.]
MSKLPNPDEVRERLRNLSTKPKDDAPKYDLQAIHERAMSDYKRIGFNSVAKAQFMELINPHLWNGKENLLRMGWHSIYKSITFSLFDKDELKAVIVRKATNHNGEVIKWKTYGSKTFTPSKIKSNDEVIFVASGIGEYLLFELMDVSYIAPQSDSVTSGIAPAMIEAARGKIIVYLQDNDDSGRKLATKLQEIFCESIFVVVDFENVQDQDLKHGYDFRDFANWTAEKWGERGLMVIEQMVTREMNFKREAMRCLKV